MLRMFGAYRCYLAVVSRSRPANVEAVQLLTGPATWFVPGDEATTYGAAGAGAVVEGGGLCPSRNAALRMAWAAGVPCVQVSDDLKRVDRAVRGVDGKVRARPLEFGEVVLAMAWGLAQTGAKLAGVAPTANPFYANVTRPVNVAGFVVGDMILVEPCDLFFDERLRLKEDYDYTLQHLANYGSVARRDDILATFTHRTNHGGAVDYRTPEREREAIALLKSKWPLFLRDNPRRPNELLLALGRGAAPSRV